MEQYRRYGVFFPVFFLAAGDRRSALSGRGDDRVNIGLFILLVGVGKLARYALVAWLTLRAA